MAQNLRPISTITTNSWTDEGTVDNDGSLHTSVDEVTIDNDDSYILDAGANTLCLVKLDTGTDPVASGGHILHVFIRSSGSSGPEKLDIKLLEDAEGTPVEIVSIPNTSNRSASYVDVGTTLNSAQTDAITNYSNLYVEMTGDSVGGGEELRVTQVYLEIPDASTNVTVNVGVQALTFSQPTLTVIVVRNITVSPGVLATVASQLTPTVTAIKNVTTSPNAQTTIFSQNTPTITTSVDVQVNPSVQALTFSQNASTINFDYTTSPSVQISTFASLSPTVIVDGEDITVIPGLIKDFYKFVETEDITFGVQTPTIQIT